VRHIRRHPGRSIATKAENATTRKTAIDDAVIDLAAVRPRRVRLRPEG
jgi:hypothetical protein